MTLESRLARITESVGATSCTRLLDVSSWRRTLIDVVPADPIISTVDSNELSSRLSAAVHGSLGMAEEVIEANERYALSLVRELERLIGGRTSEEWAPLERPRESPDGVLANRTTDEARRVVARLTDTFRGVRRWTRRQG
jgi:hypothetical protein